MAIKPSNVYTFLDLSPPKTSTLSFHKHPSNLLFLKPNSNSNLKPSIISLLFYNNTQHKHKPQHPKRHITSLFTGIVEEMGTVKQVDRVENENGGGFGFDLKIGAKTVVEDVKLGDSIAVNGTCLTVTEFDTVVGEFTVGLAPETLRKTSLVELETGSFVNLKRALLPSTRMGGHFDQGHVDGTGEIIYINPENDSLWVKVKTSPELLKYIVPKGFITVDGTSLTVIDVFDDDSCFTFMLVAYTQQNVVIPLKKVGQKVNLEVDILGKYVERLLSSGFLGSYKST